MNWSTLTTTIVSGLLALAIIVSVTVLLVVEKPVPSEFIPTLITLVGVSVGASAKSGT